MRLSSHSCFGVWGFSANKGAVRAAKETIRLPEGHSFRVLRWTRSLREVECVLDQGKTVPVVGEGAHWHFHVEMELTFIAKGQGTRFVGDHIGSFEQGDLVLIGEKLPHYWHCRGATSGVSVQWHFPESHPFWAFPELLGLRALFERAARGVIVGGQTAVEVKRLMLALIRGNGAGRLALLIGILSRLSESGESDCVPLSRRSFSLPAGRGYQKAISSAVRHLAAHFRESVRLEDLIALSGLSRSSFARQFKQHSGRSFSDFLNGLRMEAACRDLLQTGRSVMDIALASGFTQISFFNRLFRRMHGCSPSEFRKRSQSTQ